MFTLVLLLASTLGIPSVSSPPAEGPFRLSVNGPGSRGTLVFTTAGVSFEATDPKKSRQWSYQELKQIRVVSPREIAFDTFEDGSRWRFGADRRIEFEVTEETVDGSLVAFLLENITRPVMSSVLPASLGEPRVRVGAKHLRGRKGTHGTIAVYASGLAYEAGDSGDSRYWRFTDIESILRTSPFKLLINVYERGGVRPFAFELKAPLPQEAFDYVWDQVNRPVDRTGAADRPTPSATR
jgi:hypothetical protein